MTKQNAISGVAGAIIATDDTQEVVQTEETTTRGEKLKVFTDLEEAKNSKPNRPGKNGGDNKLKLFSVDRPESYHFTKWAEEKYPEILEEFREAKVDAPPAHTWSQTNLTARSQVADEDGYDAYIAESKRGGGGRKSEAAVANDMFNNASEEKLREWGISELHISMILAARNGSANAAAHLKAADDKRDQKPASEPTPPAPTPASATTGKGKGRNKGK